MTLQKYLRDCLDRKDDTVRAAALRAGWPPTTLYALIDGKRPAPTGGKLQRLARAIDADLAQLTELAEQYNEQRKGSDDGAPLKAHRDFTQKVVAGLERHIASVPHGRAQAGQIVTNDAVGAVVTAVHSLIAALDGEQGFPATGEGIEMVLDSLREKRSLDIPDMSRLGVDKAIKACEAALAALKRR